MTIIEYIGSIGGIAGVLAVLLYVLTKHLIGQMREDRKFMEDRLTHIIDAYNTTTSDNTKVLFELITWFKAKNGSK